MRHARWGRRKPTAARAVRTHTADSTNITQHYCNCVTSTHPSNQPSCLASNSSKALHASLYTMYQGAVSPLLGLAPWSLVRLLYLQGWALAGVHTTQLYTVYIITYMQSAIILFQTVFLCAVSPGSCVSFYHSARILPCMRQEASRFWGRIVSRVAAVVRLKTKSCVKVSVVCNS